MAQMLSGQSLSTVLGELLDHLDAGCLVLPEADLPRSAVHEISEGTFQTPVLRCIDGRHALGIARGHSTVSGKVSVALLGHACGVQVVEDIRLAHQDGVPLVAVFIDEHPPLPEGTPVYHGSDAEDVVRLLAYVCTRAVCLPLGPFCLVIPEAVLTEPNIVRVPWRELDRVAVENENTGFTLSDDIIQSFAEAERVLLVRGSRELSLAGRLALEKLVCELGAIDWWREHEQLPRLSEFDLILGLDADLLPVLGKLGARAANAILMHVGSHFPHPQQPSSEAGHSVPTVDVYVRTTPDVFIAQLLHSIGGTDDTVMSEGHSSKGEWLHLCSPTKCIHGAAAEEGTFLISSTCRGTFVGAAVGAAIAASAAGRSVRIDLTPEGLMAEAAALWTLSDSVCDALICVEGDPRLIRAEVLPVLAGVCGLEVGSDPCRPLGHTGPRLQFTPPC